MVSSGWDTTKPHWHVRPARETSGLSIGARDASTLAVVPCPSPQHPLPLEPSRGSASFPDVRGRGLLPELAHTYPPHKQIPPEITHHRVPAPGLSVAQPHLPTLMQDLMREVLPATGLGEAQPLQEAPGG